MNKRIITRSFQLALSLLTVLTMVIPAQGSTQARPTSPAEILTQRPLGPEVLPEAASPASVSSTIPNWVSVSHQDDVAAEIIAMIASPNPVNAGDQLTFTIEARNTGEVSWQPSLVQVEIAIYDEAGISLAVFTVSDVSPFEAVEPASMATIEGDFTVPAEWNGMYQVTVDLLYDTTVLDTWAGEDYSISVIAQSILENENRPDRPEDAPSHPERIFSVNEATSSSGCSSRTDSGWDPCFRRRVSRTTLRMSLCS